MGSLTSCTYNQFILIILCLHDIHRFCVQIPIHPSEYEIPYPTTRIPPPIQITPLPGHVMTYPRPKSSPSTFGPNVEDLVFTENPFRMKNEDYPPQMYSMSPMMPTSKAPSPYLGGDYPTSNPSVSPGRQGLIPIAPDPIGLRQMNALKRMREEEEYSEYGQRKRKRTPSQPGPVELNEEEQLLLRLKEEENLPWKDIAVRFQTDLGKVYQVPALQMRFKRLRERMRTWSETDVSLPSHLLLPTVFVLILRKVQALEQAYEYWEKFQFDIIAAKVHFPHLNPLFNVSTNHTDTSSTRCWTSGPPNDGLPSTVPENGRIYTQDGYLSSNPPTSSRIRGTPNMPAPWNQQ